MTVAALYVETGGVYYGLPDVDPWDEARDARLYDGPWPVVAHPPCNRWCRLGARSKRGQDAGTFAAALAAVRRFGGILEHPAYSQAWPAHGLPRPSGAHWTRTLLDDGWTCEVDQSLYGFPTRKPTWLYYVGPEPAPVTLTRPTNTRSVSALWSTKRAKTPPAFRDVLLDMARSSGPAPARGLHVSRIRAAWLVWWRVRANVWDDKRCRPASSWRLSTWTTTYRAWRSVGAGSRFVS